VAKSPSRRDPAGRKRPSERGAAHEPVLAPGRAVPLFWSALPALVALAVYLLQAPPVSGDKDASEFTLVLALNGVAHPTGYPLYTLFGHLFVRALHSLGATWSYAANAWSAVGGAFAIFFLHALAARLIPPGSPLTRRARFLVAHLPLGLFAFNPMWSLEATLAEVYSWHVALVCGMGYLCVGLIRALASREPPGPARLRLHAALWGLLCGVGLAHHVTSLFVSLPLSIGLVWTLWRARRLSADLVVIVVVTALLPLSSYALLWRGAQHPGPAVWPTLGPSAGDVYRHATGAMYRYLLGRFAPSPEQQFLLGRYIYPLLFPALLLLAIATVVARGRAERVALAALLAAALMTTACGFSFGFWDPSSYFVAPLALGLAGLAPLGAAFATPEPAVRRAGLVLAGMMAVLCAVLGAVWLQTGAGRRSTYVAFDGLVHSMWASIPSDSGIVFWPDDMYRRLEEYQMLRGEKRGLEVLHPVILTNAVPRERFIQRHGFDPFEGVPLPQRDDDPREAAVFVEAFEHNINRRTTLPVILFDAASRSVRRLVKPASRPPDSLRAP
jgi:hypothetical protein